MIFRKVKWWMLWISSVGIQNWWKPIEFHLPFCKCSLSGFFWFLFFFPFFVILIFHTRWQCLSTSAWQGNWFNLSRGREILLFHVSFYIHSLKNCRWETGFWWATYGWAKKNAFFSPFSLYKWKSIQADWTRIALAGCEMNWGCLSVLSPRNCIHRNFKWKAVLS